MIANISPAVLSFSETLSTLKFAQRAKLIQNKASINQLSLGSSDNLLREINRLKEELANQKTLVNTLENQSRGYFKDSATKESDAEVDVVSRELLESNRNQIKLEVLLRESLEVISGNEVQLQEELNRKSEFLNMFNSLCNLHRENDTKTKNLIMMYKEKLQNGMLAKDEKTRYKALLEENVSCFNLKSLLNSQKILREIAQNAPLIMQVFEENLNLKEKIREFEVDDGSTEFNIREKIDHNHIFLMEVQHILQESVAARELMNDKFEKLCYMKGVTPDDIKNEKLSRAESVNQEIYGDMDKEIEELKIEKLTLRDRVAELEQFALEMEDKLEERDFIMKKLHEEKESLSFNYEKRITQLKEGFQDKTSFLSMKISEESEEDAVINPQSSANLEEIDLLRKRVEELEQELVYTQNQFKIQLKQKEDLISLNQNALERARIDSESKNIKSKRIESTYSALEQELNEAKREKETLTKKVAELLKEQDNFRNNLEKALEIKFKLQNELNEIKASDEEKGFNAEKLNDFIRRLELDVEREKLERNKLRDELETIQESYSYTLDQLETLQRNLSVQEEAKRTRQSQREQVQSEDQGEENDSNLDNTRAQRRRDNSRSESRSKSQSKNEKGKTQAKSGKMSVRRNKVKDIVGEMESTVEEYKQQIETLNLQISGLEHVQSEYQKVKNIMNNQSKQLEELQANLNSGQCEIDELEQKLKEESTSLRVAVKEKLDVQKKIHDLEKLIEKLKQEEQHQEKKIVNLQSRLSVKMDEYHAVIEEMQGYKALSDQNSDHLLKEREKV